VQQSARRRALQAPTPAPVAAPKPAPAPAPAARPPRKLSYKEQRELDELPARIEALEAEQKELGELLASSALYTEAPQRVAEVQARYDQIEGLLMDALERWETLGSR
jgi:ABC transport system ATP-binding/permease protein